MHIQAPGKMFWLGEYAVLDGAPAIVAAVNRFVHVQAQSVEPRENSPAKESDAIAQLDFSFGARNATARLVAKGELTPASQTPEFALVRAVLARAASLRADGRALRIIADSSALSGDTKLGLGSSGAVASALVAAVCGGATGKSELERLAMEAHADFQHGVGSGADVLASLHGGLSVVRNGQRERIVNAHPEFVTIWTGNSADSRTMVRALRVWRASQPAAAGVLFSKLAALAEAGAELLAPAKLGANLPSEPAKLGARPSAEIQRKWADIVEEYYATELEISTASGVAIVTEQIAELHTIARMHQFACKPSGAGGGDVVVCFPEPGANRAAFEQAVAARGYDCIPLDLAFAGVLEGVAR